MNIAQLERQRRNSKLSVRKLADRAQVDRRKLGYVLDGLTDEEIARVEEVLRAHAG